MSRLACAVLVSCLAAAALAEQAQVDSTGVLKARKSAQMKRAIKSHLQAPAVITESGAQLCKSLQKVMKERRCGHRGVSVVRENKAIFMSVSKWPISGCDLPKPLLKRLQEGEQNAKASCTVAFAASSKNVESNWHVLPKGGVVVVPLRVPQASSLVRSESDHDPEDLIWQVMYQINSKLYFPDLFGEKLKLGLPALQFATFMPGHALLQKADYHNDLQNSNGTFWQLAKASGTDKIDLAHNYSLLYHRHLDQSDLFEETGGMMLEIGLGCMLEPGDAAIAGASAKIWPRLFPSVAVHFVEIDRLCTARWQPHMQDAGVAKVHIGPQADPNILAEVAHDAKFAGPGGFGSVVDDGSHLPADIEASFRALMPHLKKGGVYFIEDIMFATWQAYLGYETLHDPKMTIQTKYDRSSATPVALAAVLAAGVTGLTDVPAINNKMEVLQQELVGVQTPDTSLFGPISDRVNAWKSYMTEPFVTKTNPVTYPVSSYDKPEKWRNEVLSASGALVDLIECSPGICAFRRA